MENTQYWVRKNSAFRRILILLHSERPKLCRVLAALSAVRLTWQASAEHTELPRLLLNIGTSDGTMLKFQGKQLCSDTLAPFLSGGQFL